MRGCSAQWGLLGIFSSLIVVCFLLSVFAMATPAWRVNVPLSTYCFGKVTAWCWGLDGVHCFYFYIFMKWEIEGNYSPFSGLNLIIAALCLETDTLGLFQVTDQNCKQTLQNWVLLNIDSA